MLPSGGGGAKVTADTVIGSPENEHLGRRLDAENRQDVAARQARFVANRYGIRADRARLVADLYFGGGAHAS